MLKLRCDRQDMVSTDINLELKFGQDYWSFLHREQMRICPISGCLGFIFNVIIRQSLKDTEIPISNPVTIRWV